MSPVEPEASRRTALPTVAGSCPSTFSSGWSGASGVVGAAGGSPATAGAARPSESAQASATDLAEEEPIWTRTQVRGESVPGTFSDPMRKFNVFSPNPEFDSTDPDGYKSGMDRFGK